jgi:hypothetical protein
LPFADNCPAKPGSIGKDKAMTITWLAQRFSLATMSVVAMLCLVGPASAQPFEWQSATPESQGMSNEKLDALKEELAQRKTHTFLGTCPF